MRYIPSSYLSLFLAALAVASRAAAFVPNRPLPSTQVSLHLLSTERRSFLMASLFGSFFGGGRLDPSKIKPSVPGAAGPTNEVVKKVQGIRRKRLGGSDIIVSELGLGTQRWVSADFNAPDEGQVFSFMDKAILQGGVNLIDTAGEWHVVSLAYYSLYFKLLRLSTHPSRPSLYVPIFLFHE